MDGRPFDTTEYVGWLNYVLEGCYSATPLSTSVKPMSSERFLRTTSDERAYFWSEGGDVAFTPDMCRWLGELRVEYDEIIACLDPVPANCAKNLVETLARAQEGWGAFFFSPAFDEFMAHAEHRDVQATIVLLNRLLDGYVPGGEYLNREGWVWSTPYSRFNDNFGKYAIKLFLAVLGNQELRKRVFNF